MIVLDGFLYIISTKKEDKTRWRGKERACKGFLWIKNQCETVIATGTHICDSDKGKTSSTLARLDVMARVRASNENFTSIFTSETSSLDTSALSNLTGFSNVRDYSRRLRNERDDYLISPQDDVPISLQITLYGDKFVR